MPCRGKANRWICACACLAPLLAALVLAGCGSERRRRRGSDRDQDRRRLRRLAALRAGAGADALPAGRKGSAGTAAEAGLAINTHALIEFPPAIHDGVAYVINKYGNGKAVRLQRPQGPLGTGDAAQRQGQAELRHRARLLPGHRLRRLPRRQPRRRRRQDRAGNSGCASSAPTSNPRRWRSTARSTSAPTRPTCVALRASDGRVRWRFNAPGGDQSQPQPPRRPRLRRRLRELDVRPRRRQRQAALADQHQQGRHRSARAASSPRPRSASAGSTPPATTAPSSPSTKRPARSTWSFDSGDPVYGSPAVAQVPGTPPTVYIGAENGRFFALDAATGKAEWQLRRRRPDPRHRRP